MFICFSASRVLWLLCLLVFSLFLAVQVFLGLFRYFYFSRVREGADAHPFVLTQKFVISVVALAQWSSRGAVLSPGGPRQCLGVFWVVTTQRGLLSSWVEAGEAVEHPVIHKTAPTARNNLALTVHGAADEKRLLRSCNWRTYQSLRLISSSCSF